MAKEDVMRRCFFLVSIMFLSGTAYGASPQVVDNKTLGSAVASNGGDTDVASNITGALISKALTESLGEAVGSFAGIFFYSSDIGAEPPHEHYNVQAPTPNDDTTKKVDSSPVHAVPHPAEHDFGAGNDARDLGDIGKEHGREISGPDNQGDKFAGTV